MQKQSQGLQQFYGRLQVDMSSYFIQPAGDHAVTVNFGNVVDPAINRRVMQLFHWLQEHPLTGMRDAIPAYASLTVVYDLLQVAAACGSQSPATFVSAQLASALANSLVTEEVPGRLHTIPVCYHPSLGIDLEAMANQKQSDPDHLIELHTNQVYRIYMLGFLPGFPYMGVVDEKLATPRKTTPRQLVPAGSVGIAGVQTGIYPVASPGGWNIIGQTPLRLFDPYRDSPCLLQPGDEVRFESITLDQFYQLKRNA